MTGFLVDLLIDAVCVAFGVRLGWRMHRDRDAAERPYRWDCMEDDCVFHFESNDPDLTVRAADNHEKDHAR